VLRAPTTELAAPEGKAEATTAAPEKDSEAEGQRRVTCRRVRVVAAAVPGGRDRASLKREQPASDGVKAHQNRLINSAGFNDGDQVRLYRPTRTTEESPNSC
jgi:hypothetical protein